MCITVEFIRIVSAVIFAITDESRQSAEPRSTLKSAWLAFKFRTIIRLVRPITTVVHGVTFPPEWDTFISFASKLTGCAVG